MFSIGHSKRYHSKHALSKLHGSKVPNPPFHHRASSFSQSRTSAPIKPVASDLLSAQSNTQPSRKASYGAFVGGIFGALILALVFGRLLVSFIRGKYSTSHSKPQPGNTEPTDYFISAPAALENETYEMAPPKAVTKCDSSPETPLGDKSNPQYTAAENLDYSNPTRSDRSTQTQAVPLDAATPYNSPFSTYPTQRRGISFTESGRSISPPMTVAKITARLEQAEAAQNAIVDD